MFYFSFLSENKKVKHINSIAKLIKLKYLFNNFKIIIILYIRIKIIDSFLVFLIAIVPLFFCWVLL